jgi:hypothetical protein
VGAGLGGAHLITEDGRAFALRAVPGSPERVELISWEGFGPYLIATRVRRGWDLEGTLAGFEMQDDAQVLCLVAAELLRRDDQEDACRTLVTAFRRAGVTGGAAGGAGRGTARRARPGRTRR